MTSVRNEKGQVLISVLTATEGAGLDLMTQGIVRRYREAGQRPPKVLYVDCGCCKDNDDLPAVKEKFRGWPDLIVRLDIYHFMRRLARGCSSDAHPLYPTFMSRLAASIFELDPNDLALLRVARREQMRNEGVPDITDAMVDKRITKDDLKRYCRRRTRGEETTIRLIDSMLQELMGDNGKDLMGVPLLDAIRMENLWRVQKRHVKCLQDVPGVPLYTETGTTTVGGIQLTSFRCARGSSSLESFHLHLNRFIPGELYLNVANVLN